jgi:hypothetical protein
MKSLVHRTDGADGRVYLRDAIVAACFFPPPVHESAGGVVETLRGFLAMAPPGSLTWAVVGASAEEWSPVTPRTIPACERILHVPAAAKRRFSFFHLADGAVSGSAPGYSFLLDAQSSNERLLPESMCLLQFGIPMEALTDSSSETFVTFVREAFSTINYSYAYVSPCLMWSEIDALRGIPEAREIAARFPGYDLQDNRAGRLRIGRLTRGARWLTFLAEDILASLGGLPALRAQLSDAIAVEPHGTGAMIRAGQLPELSDVNRGERAPLLREVARALIPVTQFDELTLLGGVFHRDEGAMTRWQRRFLD